MKVVKQDWRSYYTLVSFDGFVIEAVNVFKLDEMSLYEPSHVIANAIFDVMLFQQRFHALGIGTCAVSFKKLYFVIRGELKIDINRLKEIYEKYCVVN